MYSLSVSLWLPNLETKCLLAGEMAPTWKIRNLKAGLKGRAGDPQVTNPKRVAAALQEVCWQRGHRVKGGKASLPLA